MSFRGENWMDIVKVKEKRKIKKEKYLRKVKIKAKRVLIANRLGISADRI